MKPMFEHRHYVKLAEMVASMSDNLRPVVAEYFAAELRGTNPRYSKERFLAAALGAPCNGRDKSKGGA